MPTSTSDNTPDNETKFQNIIDERLTLWHRYWNLYMWAYYGLGVLGVICSTLAASTLFAYTSAPQWFSLISAVCLAIIGFVRPEAKYRNMVRAWTDLKDAKESYLFKTDQRSDLLRALHEGQKIATQDDIQVAGAGSGQPSAEESAQSAAGNATA
jgi:hypothetical protein